MSRLLAVCLFAYPRSTRRRDGAYLVDLSLELAAGDGVRRQALSLLRNGLAERLTQRSRPVALLVGAALAAVLTLGGVAVAADASVQVEERSCAGAGCSSVRAWAQDLERRGWSCEQSSTPADLTWQCVGD